MCCFSGSVSRVADTRIFARLASPSRQTQYLVYQMVFAAREPVAMILPLPVRQPSSDISCRFHDLKNASGFFEALNLLFPSKVTARRPRGRRGVTYLDGGASQQLPVHYVGDFVASFVPTMDDFGRLAPQFVIPPTTWKRIPQYHDYGFAVLQLKAKPGQDTQPHPIALEFDTRFLSTLFFPTVHIHDGRIHPSENFDHALYLQIAGNTSASSLSKEFRMEFVASERKLKDLLSGTPEATQRIVDPTNVAYRCEMHGVFPNQDVILRLP